MEGLCESRVGRGEKCKTGRAEKPPAIRGVKVYDESDVDLDVQMEEILERRRQEEEAERRAQEEREREEAALEAAAEEQD